MLETYTIEERSEILRRYRNLIEVWHTRKSTTDRWMVRKAFRLAAEAHRDMRRRTGEPYIYHPLDVATIAAGEIGLGRTSIISALLHDVVEDTEYKLSDIQLMFGDHIARIIDGLTKLEVLEGNEISSIQAENFKKLLLTLSYDVRVILIKLADRLHNMRTLDSMPQDKKYKISSETLVLYAPLAYRLGLYAIKSELEDLSLKHMQPDIYKDIKKKLNASREARDKNLLSFLEPIKQSLDATGMKYRVIISEKPVSAIFERMTSRELPFEEVHDTFVLRFIIDCPEPEEKIECWRVYATITSHYKPNNDRLRDWISLPKANGYESLHLTVMSKTGRWIEVQVRSERMDEIAEKGYAAYWKYKDSDHSESGLDEWLNRIRELFTAEDVSAIDFVDSFKLNLFSDEIFVFTPQGDMVSLPAGSTALDFAYNIHTQLGNHCIGANVNHKLVQLNHQLKTGDQVEIITSKVQKPKEEWFEFVVTARAKSRLKEAIREDRKRYKDEGREKLEAYLKQINIEPIKNNIQHLMQAEGINGLVDLYYYVATDRLTAAKVKNAFREKPAGFFKLFANPFTKSKAPKETATNNNKESEKTPALLKESVADLNYTISRCCNPIPGDEVVALVFENEPMHIHRVSCPKAASLMSKFGDSIVKAKWRQQEGVTFLAGLKITGIDSVGFVHRFTEVVSKQLNLNIRSMQLESSGGLVEAIITVYVRNSQNLKDLIDKLKKIKEIKKITRIERLEDSIN
jgi:GTP diphosphokinase / guanosine-3',5'-bis(diphosphate) 3'-diphosphatase